MSLIIPKKLRALVEHYVSAKDRSKEKGGFLIGRENVIVAFIPVPNYSDSAHTKSYFIQPTYTKGIAEEFAVMVSGRIVGDMHTHPNGAIPSEQDKAYVRGVSWPYHVVLADLGDRFDWYCVDNNLRGVLLTETDRELEGVMELVAGELSMLDMGRFFVTPGMELLSTNKRGLSFVDVDKDALRVWQWGKDKNSYYIVAASAARELKMSYARVRKAFQKLGWNKK